MLKIIRQRWVITRDDADIYCGTGHNMCFKPIGRIGNTAIKTYMTENVAIASFNNSWHDKYDGERYKTLPVTETIMEEDESDD